MKHPDLMTAIAALRDQTAHVTQRLDGWVIFALGVGGTEFPRPCTGRDRRQKQPTTNIAVRQTPARLYTGNFVPL